MNQYSVVIVDDEMINIEILKKIITTHCLKLQIVGVAKTMETALLEINAKKPDIVFLDINMRDRQIFEVLDQIELIDFQIIFATAFPGYFFKAATYNPIDFIIKPFSEIAVKDAVKKATKKIKKTRKLNE
ncbi:LytR/AlgR family response regulator transcription factor [Flavobacterium sp. TSSA_36]|uniref:LytR/AlgR family response regulator transcription factor n=1 Tax=Flavobacterium sp. TSSA_36 TaxID=3447669 RepID=UPI003F2DB3BE